MNSRITLALSALHNISAFQLICALVLAIATLNASSACAMQNQWSTYKTTAALQDRANTIQKDCSIVRALPEIPRSMLNEDAAQCAIVCNNLMSSNPEFRSLVLDNSVCLWQPGIPQTTTILGVGTSSGFGCPTLAVTSSHFARHSPSKLFVQKNLCEHGKDCEACKDKDGWVFTKLINAVRQEDGTVQCMPIEILYSNTKKNIDGRLALNTLCRRYRNNNVIDVTDQGIVAMATHHCNNRVTQMTLLGVRRYRTGTLLNSCTPKDVLRIICGYIKRGTPEQVAADTRLERRENLVQAPTAAANEEFEDHCDAVGAIDCVIQ